MPDNRYFPMNWVPRWCEAYYSSDSTLRKLYFLGVYYYQDLMKQLLVGTMLPQFYGEIGSDRYLFIGKYHYPDNYIPHVVLYKSTGSSVIASRDSMGSLLYELVTPVYYKSDNHIYFKNLDVSSVSVSAVSGIIVLPSDLNVYPKETDSPFIIENLWGDLKYIDQTSQIYNSTTNTIYVGYDGGYTVYYRSTSALTKLLNSTTYISIDQEVISLELYHHTNIWDRFAQNVSIKRNNNETNLSLKTRAQHMTIAAKPRQRIAAALGLTVGIVWYTSGTAVNTSGYNDWQFQNYNRSLYIDEILTKDTSAFVFSYAPTGYVQLFLNDNLILEDSYTVSGSYLLCDSNLLRQASEGSLRAIYKHQRMKPISYPETSNLVATVTDAKLYRGILIKDEIIVENVTRKIKQEEWRWNKEQGLLSGLADFDF